MFTHRRMIAVLTICRVMRMVSFQFPVDPLGDDASCGVRKFESSSVDMEALLY